MSAPQNPPVPNTRDAACLHECTANPIFLFQVRRWIVTGCPEGYEFDAEGDCVTPAGSEIAMADLAKHKHGEWDTPCAIESWETERVFLQREEGESYGTSRAYNYPSGWRVYCVTASGALGKMLEQHGEAFWPTIHGQPSARGMEILRHALGLTGSSAVAGEKRNHFCADADDEHCEALVALGLMRHGRSLNRGQGRYYHVTTKGEAMARAAGPPEPQARKDGAL